MKITIPKIDLSAEIKKWKSAVYGKEVRTAQIEALEKTQTQMNAAVDFIVDKGNTIDNTVVEVNRVKQEAQQSANIATNKAAAAASSAKEAAAGVQKAADQAKTAESWAIGQTGKRPDENANNSKYWSEESQRQALAAKNEADRAAQYSSIIAPSFFVDTDSGILYQKAGVGVDFIVNEDCILCWRIIAGG